MKTTTISCALLFSFFALNAQTNQNGSNETKKATVRIKKVENINGVEKITDTTYTTNPEDIHLLGADIKIMDEHDGKGEKKVIIIKDGKVIGDDNNAYIKILNAAEPMDAEIEKVLKEAGVDLKGNTTGMKKIVIVDDEVKSSSNKAESKTTKIVLLKVKMTDLSAEDKAKLNKQIGATDNKLEMSEMSLFPNPHDGKFNLNFNLKNKGDASISIYNIEGKEIYSEKLPDFTGEYNKTLDISNNNKGVYFVKITQGTHAQVKKIVLE